MAAKLARRVYKTINSRASRMRGGRKKGGEYNGATVKEKGR